jgi:SAM-dependent methyltransferase
MDVSVRSDTRAAYDGLTAHHDHERWLALLLGLARQHGLSGTRVLDVGCGTGKSFMPLARLGYSVAACDLSPAMAARARRRGRAHGVRVRVADMRRLPLLYPGADLVTCLDDAVNYLLQPGDLRAALAGMRRNLRPGGLLVFDVNTLATYRAVFCDGISWTHGADTYAAVAEPRAVVSGAVYATTLKAWRGHALRAESRHVQRHYGVEQIAAALRDARLELLDLYGGAPDGTPERPPDEQRHVKTLVVARRPPERG